MQRFMKTSSKPSENNSSSQNERVIIDLASRLVEAKKNIDALLTEFQKPIPLSEAQKIVENIFRRFHLVVNEICERYYERPPFLMNDEYDVQDLLEGLLRLYFDDVKREEPTPEFAGCSTRIDFLISKEQIGIEVKRTRKGYGKKALGDDLVKDIPRYEKHPDCKLLYCFVYDPEGYVKNPRAIEDDLSKKYENMDVKVFIVPRLG